jgi:hypothetical protein
MFTRQGYGKVSSFIALLHLHLIDHPRESLNELSKLRYAFSHLEGPTLEQMIHLVDNDCMNLENFEAFITSFEAAYRDPNHANTAEFLNKVLQILKDGTKQCKITLAECKEQDSLLLYR